MQDYCPCLGPCLPVGLAPAGLGSACRKTPGHARPNNSINGSYVKQFAWPIWAGDFLLTPVDELPSAWNRALFAMALDLGGDNRDCAAAIAALGKRVIPKNVNPKATRPPKPSVDSEWSGIAVMADGWSQTSTRLAVAYADEPVQIELATCGERLLAGPWTFETTCDGKPVRVAGEWENLCW